MSPAAKKKTSTKSKDAINEQIESVEAAKKPASKVASKRPAASKTPASKAAKPAASKRVGKLSSTSSGKTSAASSAPGIRVGVGGWTYEPWRDNFYPKGLQHAKELRYASRHLTAIEINGTYYSTMKPESFKKWHDEVPDDFMFSLKASRYATNRKLLATAGESIQRFIGSGIVELKDKLGPIVWQFMPTKQFDPEDFEAFLALLPKKEGSRTLQHVMDVRHESFVVPAYQALARKYGVATVFTDADKFPSFDEPDGPIAYARLMMTKPEHPTGYTPTALDDWSTRVKGWAKDRATFVYFISGAKEKAPAAAGALLERFGWTPSDEAI